VSEEVIVKEAPPWFALVVEPNHEHSVATRLRKKGFEVYLPVRREQRKWSDRTKEVDAVIFPGYLFGRVKYADRMRVLNLKGVRSFVCKGRDPIPVDESEIAELRAITEAPRPIVAVPSIRRGQEVAVNVVLLRLYAG